MTFEFKTKGVCSRMIHFDLDGTTVRNVEFTGGCNGNLQGISAIVRGKTIEESVRIAADYTVECIRVTNDRKGSNWYGVDFETVIPKLVEKL